MRVASIVKDIKQTEEHLNLVLKHLREVIKSQNVIIGVTVETDGQEIHLKNILSPDKNKK